MILPTLTFPFSHTDVGPLFDRSRPALRSEFVPLSNDRLSLIPDEAAPSQIVGPAASDKSETG